MDTMLLAQRVPDIGFTLVALLCALAVIAVLIGTAIGAIILRTAIWLYNAMAGGPATPSSVRQPGFGAAMLIVFVSSLVHAVCSVAIAFLMVAASGGAQADPTAFRGIQVMASLFSAPISIVVLAAMTGAMLPCSFAKGIVIALLYLVVVIVIGVALMGVFFVAAFALRALMP